MAVIRRFWAWVDARIVALMAEGFTAIEAAKEAEEARGVQDED